MLSLPTSLYFCSVLASLVSQVSTVALLLCRVVSRWVRSAGGNEARLLSWANKAGTRIRGGNFRYIGVYIYQLLKHLH